MPQLYNTKLTLISYSFAKAGNYHMKKCLGKLAVLLAVAVAVMVAAGAVAMADTSDDGFYEYTTSGGKATITKYTGPSGDVTIPDTLGEYPVVAIGKNAFFNCTSLTSILIPNGVSCINEDAFESCTNLQTIVIPDSVQSIGVRAFYGCSSIASISIPDGISSINAETFSGCTSLTTVTLPDGISSIDDKAFNYCIKLTNIYIPNSVSNIGSGAFRYCSSLTSIIIPDGVTSIGDNVFSSCSSLKSITIPNGITSIGNYMFYLCYDLTNVSLPDSITSIGDYAFGGCSIENINLPDGVTSIGNYAFSGSKLTSIQIPADITCINDSVFGGCSELTDVTIPKGITDIDNYAFSSCSKLTDISIPDGVTCIGKGAFCNCTQLTNISIPNSVSDIGDDAFDCCFNLDNIIIPNGVPSIGSEVFGDCYNLSNITIPDTVTIIGVNAFFSCNSLKSITIPHHLTTISDYAFSMCDGLTSITIPDSVTYVGKYAFEGCRDLSKIIFCGSLPTIDSTVFTFPIVVFYPISNEASWSAYNDNPKQAYCIATIYLQNSDTAMTEMANVTNGHIDAPTVPLRTGYALSAWYKDPDYINLWNFSTDIITSDISLYAKWTINTYTVTFDYQDGITPTTTSQVTYNSTYGTLPQPSRTGYTFKGWYTQSFGAGNLVIANTVETIANNHTLYADWSSKPASIAATPVTYNSILISWSAVPDATKYELYRSTSPTTGFKLLTTTAFTSYTNNSVTTGLPYYYKVRAYQLVGKTKVYGDFSSLASAQTTIGTPTLNSVTAASYNSIKISWSGVTGRTKYEIYRATGDGSFAFLKATTSTSYTDKNLATGTTYHYKVIAYRTGGGKKAYGGYSDVKSAQPQLGSPKTAKAKRASSTSIKISWSAVAGRTKYEVCVSDAEDGTYTLLASTTGTSYVDKGLTAGVPRYYKIRTYRTVNGSPQYGGYSPGASATP